MPLQFDDQDLAGMRRANRWLARLPRLRLRNRLDKIWIETVLWGAEVALNPVLRCSGTRISTRRVVHEGHAVTVRILRGASPCRGVYFDIHGGAWAVGRARMDDGPNSKIAADCGFAVVSVEYRKLPRHPLEACLADCAAAGRWLLDGGLAEFGTDTLFAGGESAGAHLAALTVLRLRGHRAFSRLKGVVLFYGVYDLGGSASLRNAGPETLVLHGPSVAGNLAMLTPGLSVEERRSPELSPLYADLSGLPPVLMMVGDADPLIDDTLALAARWPEAEVVVAPEAPHGFNRLPTSMAAKSNAYARDWMRGWL